MRKAKRYYTRYIIFQPKTRKTRKKNWKNRGKKCKKTVKTGNNRKKTENYKKYRNEISTRFREMLKRETSSETSSGTSSETTLETSSRSFQMSQNNYLRAKTIHCPTPSPSTLIFAVRWSKFEIYNIYNPSEIVCKLPPREDYNKCARTYFVHLF